MVNIIKINKKNRKNLIEENRRFGEHKREEILYQETASNYFE